MIRHVHFDIETMRAKFRTQAEALHAAGLETVGNNPGKRAFLEAQHIMRDSTIEFLVGHGRCCNTGIDATDAIAAGALALGKMAGSLILSYDQSPEVIKLVMTEFARALNNTLGGNETDIINKAETSFAATPGGRA